jgi:hypothetical protein
MCHNVVVGERHNGEEPSAMQAITIGLDLAKHWFQVHGVDAAGKNVVKRRLRRAEVVAFFRAQELCLVGMEACSVILSDTSLNPQLDEKSFNWVLSKVSP